MQVTLFFSSFDPVFFFLFFWSFLFFFSKLSIDRVVLGRFNNKLVRICYVNTHEMRR